MSATIKQLEEVVNQEYRTAVHFEGLANKDDMRHDEHTECAKLAYARAEEAELTIKAMREAEQPNRFWRVK